MRKEHIDELIKLSEIKDVQQLNKQTFILGDNMALLRWMKSEMMMGYFHVGIVDPPYGISVGSMNLGATKDSKPRSYEMGEWDNAVPTAEYWMLLNYVCRNLIIWGGNYFTDTFTSCYSVEYANGKTFWLQNIKGISKEGLIEVKFHAGIKSGRSFVVWDKQNDKMSFAGGELALTTFDRNAFLIRRPRNAACNDGDKERRHPTQKPVYIYDSLHLEFIEKGWRVVDTHGGSFSHAQAAFKNNVELTIMDITESYYLSGIEAYKQNTAKGRLIF